MLKFDKVSFRYPGQSENAITDISFEIKRVSLFCSVVSQAVAKLLY